MAELQMVLFVKSGGSKPDLDALQSYAAGYSDALADLLLAILLKNRASKARGSPLACVLTERHAALQTGRTLWRFGRP